MFVVRFTNGRGFTEWYSGLAERMQADCKEEARLFSTREEAQESADFSMQNPDAFAGVYFNSGSGVWTLTATVELLD